MNFRTELNISQLDSFNHNTRFYSIGSCFANMIGEKLAHYKFNSVSNPFGIIYNPVSIFKLLSGNLDFKDSNIQNNGIWYNYHTHSDLRSESSKELGKIIEEKEKLSQSQIKKTDVLVITFGTAYTYKLLENNEIIANCHKIPQSNFSKYLLSVNGILNEFEKFYASIMRENKSLKIILTVSPVRHTKETIKLNTVSKSVLRLACHEIENTFDNTGYFPSFEIMMDDLRDYRFYKDDLLHPTEFAENYIWDKFKNSYFSNECIALMCEIDAIKTALQHKPFNPKSKNHLQFLKKQLESVKKLNEKVNFNDEINHLNSLLKS